MSIRRAEQDNGWYVGDLFYGDAQYGGSGKAFRAIKSDSDKRIKRRVETAPRSNKESPTPVGITHYTVRDGREIKHRFAVCNPNTGRPKMIHIGNENTYEANWERKLSDAIELRQQFREEYLES